MSASSQKFDLQKAGMCLVALLVTHQVKIELFAPSPFADVAPELYIKEIIGIAEALSYLQRR